MNIIDIFEYSVKGLRKASLRSLLTIIGIIIGVITLVTILSVSEGVREDIDDQLSAFGPDKMFVVPVNLQEEGLQSIGGSITQPSFGKLFQKDADAIETMAGVESVTRVLFGQASMEFKDNKLRAPIFAMDSNGFGQFGDYLELESGRLYNDGEKHVVVFANDAANEMWGGDRIRVGNMVDINDKKYRVVGVLKRIGTSLSTQDDSAIYVPFEDGEDLFTEQLADDEINFIFVDISEGFDADEIKGAIEYKLAAYHKVPMDELDFSVITADFIEETVGGVFSLLNAFLLAITVIASIVGAIGIANTMFMGVLERVKEIGILKAMGATEQDIMAVFIIESGVLGVLGGTIGLLISWFLLIAVEGFGVPSSLNMYVIAFAFFFSAGTGTLAGIIPAREAAKMDPVEALRY